MPNEIKIDVTDWVEEAQRAEAEFKGIGDLVERHVAEKWTPLKAGRMLVGAREAGMAPKDIAPPNKALLNSGAALAVSRETVARYRKAHIGGQDIRVREYVGQWGDRGQEGETTTDAMQNTVPIAVEEYIGMVESASDAGCDLARRYLEEMVPNHIWTRMVILAEHKADLRETANKLKAKIDELVERLIATAMV